MRTEVIIRSFFSLLAVTVLLGFSSVIAGTVTKTFPDVEGQMRLFLDMSLGMSHKRFRVAVPAAWFTVDLPQVESVEDVDGPSSRGWFEYRLAARGTQQPQFHLRFWKNEIVFAQLTYRHRGAVGISDEAHATAMRRIVTLLSRRFGRPDRDRSDKQHISLGWNTNGALVEFEVSPDASHALGDVSLVRFHREKLAELKTWRAGVDMSEGTGPGYLFNCARTDSVTDNASSIVETVDTRSLSQQAATNFAKRRTESARSFGQTCIAEIANNRATDILLNAVRARQRLPYTYLRFESDDGFVTSQRFEFAGPDTQDAVCEQFRNRLAQSIRESATCVTGTEFPPALPNDDLSPRST